MSLWLWGVFFFKSSSDSCHSNTIPVGSQAAWQIFTPLLHDIDDGKLMAVPYQPGSRGPKEADELSTRVGYVQTHGYIWIPPTLA